MARSEGAKRRRGHGEGSVVQRKDGLWVARLDLGIVKGKRKVKALYARTQREAIEKLAKARRELQQGLPVAVERQTVEQYFTKWLGRGPAMLKIRESTHASYADYVGLYIVPALGRLTLSKLKPTDLNDFYQNLLETGGRSGLGLSPRTVQYVHSIIHRALRDAVKAQLIIRNPAEAAEAPRPERKELTPPTTEQLVVLLAEAAKGRLYALYVLAVTCGLRQGELLGLKWADMNLDEGELQVKRKVYPKKGGDFLVSEPKTKLSKRAIALPRVAVEALRRHRVAQLEDRLAADEDWVFPNETGKLMDRRNLVLRDFKPMLKRAGLPATTRFHDCRHAMATLMLEDGTHPKVVQERLGHSSISVTLDIYSHVKPQLQREAAAKFDERFGRPL